MSGHFRNAMLAAESAGEAPSPQDRTHAALAHVLGAAVGLMTVGVLFPIVAPTLVLLFHTNRNPFVLFHVNQAAWFQAAVSALQVLSGFVFTVVYFLTCGFGVILLIPFVPLVLLGWMASVAYPLYVAYETYNGKWAKYVWLGDWVLDQKSPIVAD